MDNNFNSSQIEQELYKMWEEENFFAPADRDNQKNFCVLIPPPNITGTLHMGHAFNHTLIDILIRHSRMKVNAPYGKEGLTTPGLRLKC